jgi:hypothetical protein
LLGSAKRTTQPRNTQIMSSLDLDMLALRLDLDLVPEPERARASARLRAAGWTHGPRMLDGFGLRVGWHLGEQLACGAPSEASCEISPAGPSGSVTGA